MMTNERADFNPYHMRPLATLNSRSVAALPGVDAPKDLALAWVGQTGAQLLSKTALIELIAARAGELGLEGVAPGEYPRRLNAILAGNSRSFAHSHAGEAGVDSADAATTAGTTADSAAAAAIARTFGRRLGYLIASLVLAPRLLSDPPDAWEAAYLRWWREEVRLVMLGGGHATGSLGAAVARAAEEAAANAGLLGWRVRAAENPSFLPLIGAARSLPGAGAGGNSAGTSSAALVADFGGTRAKSGVAFYDARGRLVRLLALPPRDISAVTGSPAAVPELAAAMVAVLADGVRAAEGAAGYALDPRILCSVAAYVENGVPLDTGRGIYNDLNRISPDLKGWFSRVVSRACGRAVRVEFGHDTDLAARSQAGKAKCAVIMLGSHIGVGFAPPGEGFRELADGNIIG